jgi:hypothetical protein
MIFWLTLDANRARADVNGRKPARDSKMSFFALFFGGFRRF